MINDKPWYSFYSNVPKSIDYPQVTMYESVMRSVKRVPDKIAWDFMGTLCTYEDFARQISQCADALAHLGLKKGETITISMPTTPQGIIGIPTLYAALNKNKDFQKSELSCLKAAFCGADTLPTIVKKEFEKIVQSRGGNVKLLEGYGLTEAVTAIMATPLDHFKEGSIGVPFPDMDAKIVLENSTKKTQAGDDGEICLSGPAVMKGYLNQKEETDKVLKLHDDGKLWLHTGDIGYQDEEGFFYFRLRQKRMIKSSGMNVYPAQVEEILYQHPDVAETCVIGVPDQSQMERVKAFVVLKNGISESLAKEEELILHCQKKSIKWSCPRSIEFRKNLPTTLVGKVAFKTLQDEEIKKLRQKGEYTGEE